MRNDSSGAIIEVEGDAGDIDDFLSRLADRAPPLAVIESVDTQAIPVVGGTGFIDRATHRDPTADARWPPPTSRCAPNAPPNSATPATGATGMPFVNCTNCGPRFTIIASLPYDRASTTMAGFPMCADCAREYADPADRRFHAQPVCCPNCGPTLRYRDARRPSSDGEAALRQARQLLRDGGVLAVKGIGGYHLACDAGGRARGRRAAIAESGAATSRSR